MISQIIVRQESTMDVDSSVPLTHNDLKDLGLICLVKIRKISFRITFFRFKNPILDFLILKRTAPFCPVLTEILTFYRL